MEIEDQPQPKRHDFRIGDVMILIAALAFGFYFARTSLKSILPDPPKTQVTAELFARVRDSLPYFAAFLSPLTLACLVVGFGRGRSGLGRGFDSAGMTALVAASCIIVVQAAAMAFHVLTGTRSDFFVSPLTWGMNAHPGSAVMGTWAVQVLGGRWILGRSWVDRLGFVLGLGGVGITLTSWLSLSLIR